MTETAVKIATAKIELPARPRERPRPLPLPRRPSYQRVVENIEKWVNSSGLQKPT